MADRKRTLPEFSDPPVIEVVLGVQFSPLSNFSNLHHGLYWAKVRDEYPNTSIAPPLTPAVEQFEENLKEPTIGFELIQSPEMRSWFIDSTESKLIQLQNDRFIHNWRKVRKEDLYPRYDNLRPKFEEEWLKFCRFLEEEKLGKPDVNQCEVTYVNHIEIGTGWASYSEANKVIACWSDKSSLGFLPGPEKLRLSVTYLMPEKRGRLTVNLQPVLRRQDLKEVLQLDLTARGKPGSSAVGDIVEWFDLGHEWIVNGFADFTAKEMHKVWGIKYDNGDNNS
ncbi:MAG: TIGR04255 family protein [Nitrospirae bacterium]|nr:TIGR04255 family protein [Nitrospirota bacterium]